MDKLSKSGQEMGKMIWLDDYINQIICGDCLEVMKGMPDGCVDSIVTDSPYGLKFMGKKWDCQVPGVEIWLEGFRVLKSGGHLLSFFGTRTYHRGVVNIEDAGFEIRDQIGWIYGSGFPKSLDVSKAIDKAAGMKRKITSSTPSGGYKRLMITNEEASFRPADYYPEGNKFTSKETITNEARQWNGWGTGLKPAWECICLARKPLEGTVAENVLKHGTGAINIDGCRVTLNGENPPTGSARRVFKSNQYTDKKIYGDNIQTPDSGRFPANIIHDGSEEVLAEFPETSSHGGGQSSYGGIFGNKKPAAKVYASSGSAARFFYCAKASPSERGKGNNHPTVKPVALMRYLCRLVTPPGGIILDLFAGSGTTGIAAALEGFDFVCIDKDAEICEIARKRVAQAQEQPDLFRKKEVTKQSKLL